MAEALSDEIQRRAKEETVVSDLTYDLRSGAPDFVDKMVASTFGTMALDYVLRRQERQNGGAGGRQVRDDGHPRSEAGAKKVDIASMYNTERYRPNYANKTGLPIFLTQAS